MRIGEMEEEVGENHSRITAEKVIEILKKQGMDISLQEAEAVLFFLRKLAQTVVEEYLKNLSGKGIDRINFKK